MQYVKAVCFLNDLKNKFRKIKTFRDVEYHTSYKLFLNVQKLFISKKYYSISDTLTWKYYNPNRPKHFHPAQEFFAVFGVDELPKIRIENCSTRNSVDVFINTLLLR